MNTKNKPTGSGYGNFTKGKRITKVSEVKVGDLLLVYSRQFNAQNVAVVTRTHFDFAGHNGKMFYVQLVNPLNPAEARIYSTGNICVWHFMIGQPKSDNTMIDDFWVAKGDIPAPPVVKAEEEDDEEEIVTEAIEKDDPNQLFLFGEAA